MIARRALEELPPEWPGGRIPPISFESPQRALPTRTRREQFAEWYGIGRPGFSGGFITGCFASAIIVVLCFLFWWWVGV